MFQKSLVVDLDGTVVNTYGQKFCNIASQVCGEKIKPSHLTSYNFTAVTKLKQKHLIDIFSRQGFYKDLKPLPNAIEALNDLYKAGFELHIMTVRPSSSRAETLQWLVKYNIPLNSFHLLTHAEGGAGKSRIAKALNLSYFVEDNAAYTKDLAKVCVKGFLINTRYSTNEAVDTNVIRVNDLQDMRNYLLS
jgi:uncharacterized HAD superfamily protein